MPNITKSESIRLIRESGVNIDGRFTTFASQNNGSDTYWANPSFEALEADRWIVLNDRERQTLHLFFIPRNTFNGRNLIPRADKPNLVDIQIDYHSHDFIDIRSKISFRRFLQKSIQYRHDGRRFLINP